MNTLSRFDPQVWSVVLEISGFLLAAIDIYFPGLVCALECAITGTGRWFSSFLDPGPKRGVMRKVVLASALVATLALLVFAGFRIVDTDLYHRAMDSSNPFQRVAGNVALVFVLVLPLGFILAAMSMLFVLILAPAAALPNMLVRFLKFIGRNHPLAGIGLLLAMAGLALELWQLRQ